MSCSNFDAQKLFVGNIHFSVTEGDLIKVFQKCGSVLSVNYMWHKIGPNKGQPKGFAFVKMASVAEADLAISKLNGIVLKSRAIRISKSSEKVSDCDAGETRYCRKRSYDHSRCDLDSKSGLTPIMSTKQKMRMIQQAIDDISVKK